MKSEKGKNWFWVIEIIGRQNRKTAKHNLEYGKWKIMVLNIYQIKKFPRCVCVYVRI